MYEGDLSLTHHNIAAIWVQIGRSAEAMTPYGRVLKNEEKLAADNTNVIEFRSHLAYSHLAIGGLQSQCGRPAEAMASCQAAQEIREKRAADHPTVTVYQRDLEGCYHEIGSVHEQAGREAEVLTSYLKRWRSERSWQRITPPSFNSRTTWRRTSTPSASSYRGPDARARPPRTSSGPSRSRRDWSRHSPRMSVTGSSSPPASRDSGSRGCKPVVAPSPRRHFTAPSSWPKAWLPLAAGISSIASRVTGPSWHARRRGRPRSLDHRRPFRGRPCHGRAPPGLCRRLLRSDEDADRCGPPLAPARRTSRP